jgi:DNA-binding transcriptional LysR family regulator
MSAEQLPNLETFLQAAELGSFTAAARALKLTQAAVSQRIQALEQDLGVPLFYRQGGKAVLTEAGQVLYPEAQRILSLHREAREKVTGKKLPLAGELTLAASSIAGEYLLPGLLSAFRKKHPHIQVRATVTDSQRVVDQVEHGQANLGLVGKRSDNPHLESHSFASDTLALIVPGKHPWSQRKRVDLEELAGQPLIVREAGSGSRWCLEQALAHAGKSLRDLKVGLELGSNEGIKEAVDQGLGVAVLSTLAVKKELQSGRFQSLQVKGLPLERDMYVIWDKRRALAIPARLFIDLLKSDKDPDKEYGN